MPYIHKYKVGDDVFYRVSDSKAGSSKIVQITRDEWKGVSAGAAVNNALKFLSSLAFNKEEEEPAKEKETPEEQKTSKASSVVNSFVLRPIIEDIDKLASDLEADGRPDIALALDRISDKLEHRGE